MLARKTMMALALCAMWAAPAMAQGSGDSAGMGGGYLQSSGGVVKSGYGLCWRTGSWTEQMRDAGCEGDAPVIKRVVERMPEVKPDADKDRGWVLARESSPASAMVHFEFDRSELSMDAKRALDEMMGHLGAEGVSRVSIVGHADRIGTHEYNRNLAMSRARAVREYLISRGVSWGRIDFSERGENEPLVACEGKRVNRGLIECLAPNRRAEVRMEVLIEVMRAK